MLFFFLISIKLLQSWDSPRDQLIFFSFFCWYPYSLSSAIPYNRPNLHSYHHERIPPFQFTVRPTNVHHFECCAYFTLFICNIYGWRSCTWKCIKWCIEPPTPPPPDPCMHFFSKLVTSHASLSCIIEEKILLTAGLATQSLKLSFID